MYFTQPGTDHSAGVDVFGDVAVAVNPRGRRVHFIMDTGKDLPLPEGTSAGLGGGFLRPFPGEILDGNRPGTHKPLGGDFPQLCHGFGIIHFDFYFHFFKNSI